MAEEHTSDRQEDNAMESKENKDKTTSGEGQPSKKEQTEAATEETSPVDKENAASEEQDPHRGITGTPVITDKEKTTEPAKEKEKKGSEEISPSDEAADKEEKKTSERPAPSDKEEPQAPVDKEKDETKDKDPHRGTAETLSQHKGLDPEGERNNDENTSEGHAPGEQAEAQGDERKKTDQEK